MPTSTDDIRAPRTNPLTLFTVSGRPPHAKGIASAGVSCPVIGR